MILAYKDNVEQQMLSVLKKKWPDAIITDEQFNYEFSMKFESGIVGHAGTSNGDLGVNLYYSQEAEEEGRFYAALDVAKVIYDPMDWLNDVYKPAIQQFNIEETDFYIQQSINSSLGWLNCLNSYQISISQSDLEDFEADYIQWIGKDIYED